MAKTKKENVTGYPLHPDGEDLYSPSKEEVDIDPERPDQFKKRLKIQESWMKRILSRMFRLTI